MSKQYTSVFEVPNRNGIELAKYAESSTACTSTRTCGSHRMIKTANGTAVIPLKKEVPTGTYNSAIKMLLRIGITVIGFLFALALLLDVIGAL